MDAWEGDDDEMVELVRAAADAGGVVDAIPWTRVVELMIDLKGVVFEVAVAFGVVGVDARFDYYYFH